MNKQAGPATAEFLGTGSVRGSGEQVGPLKGIETHRQIHVCAMDKEGALESLTWLPQLLSLTVTLGKALPTTLGPWSAC